MVVDFVNVLIFSHKNTIKIPIDTYKVFSPKKTVFKLLNLFLNRLAQYTGIDPSYPSMQGNIVGRIILKISTSIV